MSTFLWILAALLLAAHLYRTYWAHRSLPAVGSQPFDGELLRVGETYIARRAARNGSTKTVICFPGFLEDMRYFTALYENADCELILVNNANYHCPFDAQDAQRLEWPENPFAVGTIEHDGYYLAQVIRELASGPDIILHGHSRGGAVVLEAGRQFPKLMKQGDPAISAILEAPVLPQGRMVGNGSDSLPHYLIRYFLPVVLGLSRNSGPAQLRKQPMMQPSNPLKEQICQTIYTNARSYATCVENVKSIRRWQLQHGFDLYRNFERITVVMGERDDVLDNASMLVSASVAQESYPGVSVLHTENTNHFPSLEQPHYLRELAGVA
ncbi:MAG: hypothetical protein Hals2KO_35530 [Halioglobus sp.]